MTGQGRGHWLADETIDFTSKPTAASHIGGIAWDLAQTVLLAVAIFLGIRVVIQNFKVEGTSMEPSLHNGQYLIVIKAAYARIDGTPFANILVRGTQPPPQTPVYLLGEPSRGDIAVFLSPTPGERDFIKRIIGVPGDKVEVKSGVTYLNGTALTEPYIRGPANYEVAPEVVPSGYYFVLGDNRPKSSDSHVWGFLPAGNLIGKAWLSYWPPPEWGLVPTVQLAG